MSRMYRSKTDYIEALNTVLEARDDFDHLEYHRHPSTGKEYLFLSALTGEVFMFDVTGYSEANIFHLMARVECEGLNVDNLIKDPKQKLEIAKLFR